MPFFITLQVHNTGFFFGGRYDGIGNSKFIASFPGTENMFFFCFLKFLLSNMNLYELAPF